VVGRPDLRASRPGAARGPVPYSLAEPRRGDHGGQALGGSAGPEPLQASHAAPMMPAEFWS
jgi:hypothetical protein